MNLARELSHELLKGGDIEQLKYELSLEINERTLGSWFACKMQERDLEGASGVLDDMVKLGYDCERLAVRLFTAEQAWARRIV